MKAILALLVMSLMSPVFAQDFDDSSTGVDDMTTTEDPAVYDDSPIYSDDTSELPSDSVFEDTDPSLSGSATDADETPVTSPATAQDEVTDTAETTDTTTSRTYSEETMREDRIIRGFYIEPAILGSRQDADIEGNIGADTTGTSNSFGVDLKLGGHVGEMFFLGADGRYERAQFEGSALDDTDANIWNWGPTVGVQAPYMGLRAWGTYVVDGNYNPEEGVRNVDLKFTDPYGWRGGIGFRLASVSLNLEYEDLTYRTTEVESAGDFAVGTGTDADFSQRGYAVSLSFPVEL